MALGEHIISHSHLYEQFSVVADDLLYISPLLEIAPNVELKLFRKNNYHTKYSGTNLRNYPWQNMRLAIGHTLGLSLYEM